MLYLKFLLQIHMQIHEKELFSKYVYIACVAMYVEWFFLIKFKPLLIESFLLPPFRSYLETCMKSTLSLNEICF